MVTAKLNALHEPVCLHLCDMHMQHQMTTTGTSMVASPDKDVINQVYRYGIQGDTWSTLPVPSQYYSIPQDVDGKITLFGGWHKKRGKVACQFLHFTLITHLC